MTRLIIKLSYLLILILSPGICLASTSLPQPIDQEIVNVLFGWAANKGLRAFPQFDNYFGNQLILDALDITGQRKNFALYGDSPKALTGITDMLPALGTIQINGYRPLKRFMGRSARRHNFDVCNLGYHFPAIVNCVIEATAKKSGFIGEIKTYIDLISFRMMLAEALIKNILENFPDQNLDLLSLLESLTEEIKTASRPLNLDETKFVNPETILTDLDTEAAYESLQAWLKDNMTLLVHQEREVSLYGTDLEHENAAEPASKEYSPHLIHTIAQLLSDATKVRGASRNARLVKHVGTTIGILMKRLHILTYRVLDYTYAKKGKSSLFEPQYSEKVGRAEQVIRNILTINAHFGLFSFDDYLRYWQQPTLYYTDIIVPEAKEPDLLSPQNYGF